jgi:phenylacetate-CoA ligase
MGTPHLQTGMSLKRGLLKKFKDLLFLCSYTSAFELTDAALEKIIRKLETNKIKYLFGYASSIYVIASYAEQHNYRLNLSKIFTWGDCLFPHYRSLIETVFSCKVLDCYGLGEGLQVACQCEFCSALHIAEHNVIVEILDGSGENIYTSDQLGKVVVTRLEPGPMPLLRYDTGDLASFVSGPCECGRNLSLLSRIQGRDTDVIQSPDGDRLIVHFFTQIFEMIPEIIQFQVRQEKLDEINISFIPGLGFHSGILNHVANEIHDNCKFRLKINFFKVKNIPLEKSNKRRFVISTIPFLEK